MPLWQRWQQTTIANQAMVIGTALVAVGTLCLTIAGGFQYLTAREQSKAATEQSRTAKEQASLMKKQLDTMREQSESMKAQTQIQTDSLAATKQIAEQNERSIRASEIQARASQQAVFAAQRAANAAEGSMFAGQSAYIVAKGVGINDVILGTTPIVTIAFTNAGNTPATNVHFGGRIAFRDRPVFEEMPSEPDSAPAGMTFGYRNATEDATVVIGPNVEVNSRITSPYPVDQQTMDLFNQRKLRLYVWGTVTYDDVFGFHHATQYCYGLLSGATLTPCGAYNTVR